MSMQKSYFQASCVNIHLSPLKWHDIWKDRVYFGLRNPREKSYAVYRKFRYLNLSVLCLLHSLEEATKSLFYGICSGLFLVIYQSYDIYRNKPEDISHLKLRIYTIICCYTMTDIICAQNILSNAKIGQLFKKRGRQSHIHLILAKYIEYIYWQILQYRTIFSVSVIVTEFLIIADL